MGAKYRDQSWELIHLIKVNGEWQIKEKKQLGIT